MQVHIRVDSGIKLRNFIFNYGNEIAIKYAKIIDNKENKILCWHEIYEHLSCNDTKRISTINRDDLIIEFLTDPVIRSYYTKEKEEKMIFLKDLGFAVKKEDKYELCFERIRILSNKEFVETIKLPVGDYPDWAAVDLFSFYGEEVVTNFQMNYNLFKAIENEMLIRGWWKANDENNE